MLTMKITAAGLSLTLLLAAGCTHNQMQNTLRRSDGNDALRAKDYDTARQQYNAAVEADPSDWRSYYYLGVVELQSDNPLAAQLALEKALAVRYEDEEWRNRITDRLAEAIYQQDEPDRLYAFLNDAASEHGTTADYLRLADYMEQSGDVDAAVTALDQAAAVAKDDDPRPYLRQADLFASIGDDPRAIKALQHALYIEPDNADVPDRLRQYGIVPGPTQRIPPERASGS